jgi:hypothetical protein
MDSGALGHDLRVKITEEYARLVAHGALHSTTRACVKRPID